MSLPHIGTSEMISPRDGLKTGEVSTPGISRHSPPMKTGQGDSDE
jgi:hypothetical protein